MKTKLIHFSVFLIICLNGQNAFSQEIKSDERMQDKEFLFCVQEQFRGFDLVHHKENSISVFGQVEQGGNSYIPSEKDLERALKHNQPLLTLIEAIAMAGGLKKKAHKRILIVRGSDTIIVDLQKLISGETPNMALKLNDTIYVPEDCKSFWKERRCIEENDSLLSRAKSEAIENPLREHEFRVVGQVVNPTKVETERPVTIWEVLAFTGGLKDNADDFIKILTFKKKKLEIKGFSYKKIIQEKTENINLNGRETIVVFRDCRAKEIQLSTLKPTDKPKTIPEIFTK